MLMLGTMPCCNAVCHGQSSGPGATDAKVARPMAVVTAYPAIYMAIIPMSQQLLELGKVNFLRASGNQVKYGTASHDRAKG